MFADAPAMRKPARSPSHLLSIHDHALPHTPRTPTPSSCTISMPRAAQDADVTDASAEGDSWAELTGWVQLGVAVADLLSLHDSWQHIRATSTFSAQRQPSSRKARTYNDFELSNDSDVESEVDSGSDSDYCPSDVELASDAGSDDDTDNECGGLTRTLRPRRAAARAAAIAVAAIGRRSLAPKLDFRLNGTLAEESQPAARGRQAEASLKFGEPLTGKDKPSPPGRAAPKRHRSVSVDGSFSAGTRTTLSPRTRSVMRRNVAETIHNPVAATRLPSEPASKLEATPARQRDARAVNTIGEWLESTQVPPPDKLPREDGPGRPHIGGVPGAISPAHTPTPSSRRINNRPPTTLPLREEHGKPLGRKRRGKGLAKLPRAQQPPEVRERTRAKDVARKERSAAEASREAQTRVRALSPAELDLRQLSGNAARQVLQQLASVNSSVRLTGLLTGRSYFIGPSKYRDNQLPPATPAGTHVPLDSRCNRLVRKLVRRDQYTYVPNDPTRAQACFDGAGKMFAVKAKPPAGSWYQDAITVVTRLATDLRKSLHLADQSPNAGRNSRGAFRRFTFGTSFGGGQKEPTRISPDWTESNEALIVEFLSNKDVQKVLKHVESVVSLFYPRLARMYRKLQAQIHVPDVLRQLDINLPFAAHTFNLGPYVACWFHRDARNFILGICPVLVLGDFDHRTSGHFIMVEPKIIMELRPGDLLLMMSAVLTHGNAPLRRGETRLSWTFFTAGGLFRWAAAKCRLVSELSEEEFVEYCNTAAEYLQEAWDAIPTYDELQARASAL